jgi:serine protease AprX
MTDAAGTTWARGTTWTFGASALDRRRGTTWPRRLVAALVVSLMLTPFAGATGAALASGAVQADDLVEVIVTRAAGASGAAERAVVEAGGAIVRRLDIVDGFSARIPARHVPTLATDPGVQSVAPNRDIQFFSRRMTGDALRGTASLDQVRRIVDAEIPGLFGINGSGVSVGVIDTGVTEVKGLDNGQVVQGPDITSEANHNDGFGHGTFMASIIGGDDKYPSGGVNFRGVADDAGVVAVKAAKADGSTDLFTVLAALDWIVQYKDVTKTRVVNLSFGVDAQGGDYRSDPLAAAVERVWKAGIVVVAAAGNNGEKPGSAVTSPGYDPFVITVGAADTNGTDSLSDDTVEEFSPTGGPRTVDLVAPGRSLLGLRVPGSTADVTYPSARVGDRLFKGTGTSEAAAVVSGVVASLLEARPNLTPDQVKAVLKASAVKIPNASTAGQGSGMVNLIRAVTAPVPANATQTWEPAAQPPPPPPARPAAPPCPPGSELPENEGACIEPTGGSWTGGSWTGGSWTGGSWTGGSWTGGSWTSAAGDTWTGGSWTGGSWTGGSWTGGSWTGGSWTGGSWTGGSWTGGSWTGGSWTGGSWTGGSWTGGSWTGGSWTGGSWTGGSWTGGSWTGGSWTGGSWTGGSWTGGSWTGGSWTGGSWTGGSWTGGSWTGGSWTGGSWTGGSWTGGSWTGGSWTGGSWTGDAWTSGAWT